MTVPPQRRCQAPGCGRPIPAERLRRHPSTQTCSDQCRDTYRKVKTSRSERRKRKAKKNAAAGWQGVPCDYHLRLACSRPLKDLFDASIPPGQTAASWLREILVTLMSTKGGLGMWALNALVVVAMQRKDERKDDIAHGRQALSSDIPALLWGEIRKRAAKEGFNTAAPWLRRVVVSTVRGMEHWRPQTPAQQFKRYYVAFCIAGRTDEFFLRVANSLMNCRSDEYFDDDKIPRYSRWGVSSVDDLSDHPILHRYEQSAVPKHVLFDKLWNGLIPLYNQGRRSKDFEMTCVNAILNTCDPRVGEATFR